ncbi:endonuclease/exonuclease/phosphatase family protein [Microlunatus antarcticus]|uniref:Endonuclease/exonuclease/phosphatase family metal-dependent hydrolase n=1 Tax=Microlunatus antarcticus TaxID=53388 RepID=A0A7W5JZ74_9ACTN|nr:endonuclease/exonuclease/phosphatase family protein [Microlunatus antarcticus]MBB3329041.1 endonuclease/exonuclease/phosphatase family metal-dependent hydrolase [Microlunatus antarcticus]
MTALVAVFSAVLPASASASSKPGAVKSVVASPGAAVGQIKVSWKASGSKTDKFRIETALTPFGSTNDGRGAQTFTVSGSKRSTTLSAKSVAKAGAAPATGNHLYIRVVAVDERKSGARTGKASDLVATTSRALPAAVASPLRIASYNIRSAKYDGADKRDWAERAPGVASDIVKVNPGIVAIQEASPGRFGTMRQTESLQAALIAADPAMGRYTLTRTTVYNPSGTPHGSQAARIAYDSSRYQLLSQCTDTTMVANVVQNWSNSCSFDLPVMAGDAPTWIRSAAYAEFADLATGKPFLVVSAHLDYRHSDNKNTEAKLNDLRRLQAATIWANMNLIRKPGEPVIVAGDFNASQADKGGNGPHDYLVEQGFYDAAGAVQQANLEFPSLNHFDKVLDEDPQGYARRVDQILVYGAPGSNKFKQLVEQKNPARNSDHNMVYADITLPTV